MKIKFRWMFFKKSIKQFFLKKWGRLVEIEMNETKIPGEFSYMDPIKFSDYKQKIIDALNSRQSYLGINEPTTLIDGFFSQPLQNEFTSDLIIGGPTIPMIMILGNNSGRIYYFALKVLLPDFNV